MITYVTTALAEVHPVRNGTGYHQIFVVNLRYQAAHLPDQQVIQRDITTILLLFDTDYSGHRADQSQAEVSGSPH